MKKTLALLMILSLLTALLTGCGDSAGTAPADQAAEQAAEPSVEEDAVDPSDEQATEPGSLGGVMPDFETRDLDGNTVTNDIFAQKDLTVVNIWGTFCSPCIQEMPELGEWMREMPDNVQLIGIVCDLELNGSSEIHDTAVQILKEADAEFVSLEVDDALLSMLENGLLGVPTTLLVDREGSIIGEPILGADVPAYQQAVEDYFQ